MDDDRLRVCLDRTVELEGVRLHLRDWPGRRGPLVWLPDPLGPTDFSVDALAAALAPNYRVLSLRPRGTSPYQVDAGDVLATLDQFGFLTPVLIGERLGCVPALVVAAWYPGRVAGLVLVNPTYDPPSRQRADTANSVEARALRDCPPDWPALRNAVRCPVLVLRQHELVVDRVREFLDATFGTC